MIHSVLLDTDVTSEILKGKDLIVLKHAAAYAAVVGHFTFTAVTVHEILYGLHHKDARRQLLVAEQAFVDNEVVLPALDDYRTAGLIRGVARRQGIQLAIDDWLDRCGG